jgi:anti-sigma regulatory factor (Ser/Thr protein kinase)
MRRNAESLLVLAGIDGSRRLRTSMAVSDVVRTAASEIENFERIDLANDVDPAVLGRFALPAAHLLAELLENATHFSDPGSRVVVSTRLSDDGLELTVTDSGLGMSDADIVEANHKIGNPPATEIAVAQRLGFYVVGRLAQRLGATIQVRRGQSIGTVVVVALPAEVFEPGSVPSRPSPTGPPSLQSPVAVEPLAHAVPEATEAEPSDTRPRGAKRKLPFARKGKRPTRRPSRTTLGVELPAVPGWHSRRSDDVDAHVDAHVTDDVDDGVDVDQGRLSRPHLRRLLTSVAKPRRLRPRRVRYRPRPS